MKKSQSAVLISSEGVRVVAIQATPDGYNHECATQ